MHHRLSRILSCTLLAVAPLPALAASDAGWYIGTAAGSANNNIPGLVGYNWTQSRTNGYKLFAGYQFNSNFATELEYLRLGSWRGEFDGGEASARSSAITMSGVGIVPLGAQLSVFGKLGLAAKYVETKVIDGPDFFYQRKSRTSTYHLGVGSEWAFTRSLALRAEYQHLGRTRIDDDGTKMHNSLLSLGLRYRF